MISQNYANLENAETREIVSPVNEIYLSNEDIESFGDLVGDHSRIHRSTKAAKEKGFDDTPVMGVHLAAIGGKLSRGLLEIIRQNNPEMKFVGQRVIFKNPVYPGRKRWPKWEFEGIKISREGIITPTITAKRDGEINVEIQSRFSNEIPTPRSHNNDQFLYAQDVEIKPKEIRSFYEQLKENPNDRKMAFSHGVSLIPSTLLSFLGEVNQLHGKQTVGMNREMNSEFYGEVAPENSRIEIYEKSSRIKPDRGLFVYTFDSVLSQQGTPKVSSRIKCVTTGDVPIRSLREKFGYAY